MTRRPSKQDDNIELDRQLEKELEGTFPASDPIKINRFPIEGHRAAEPASQKDTDEQRGARGQRQLEAGPSKPGMATKRSAKRPEAPMSKKIAAESVKLKRAYEPPDSDDGTRILIDRLWPRGLRKADADIDEWMKDLAPSTALRKWFGHKPERWPEFRRRYRSEIEQHPEQFHRLRAFAERGQITLVFSAHDEAHNDAVVLKELLLSQP